MTLNLDSLRSRPELPTAALTPRELERQIAHLHAKLAMVEAELRKLMDAKVSRRVVEAMLARHRNGKPRKAGRDKPSYITSIRALERWVEGEMRKERQRGRDRRRLIKALASRIEVLETKA